MNAILIKSSVLAVRLPVPLVLLTYVSLIEQTQLTSNSMCEAFQKVTFMAGRKDVPAPTTKEL